MKLSRGFTLVELLVVIAIIGVLVALLLPAVQAAREAARRTQCRNNLRQLGLALHNYHDAHSTFPASHDTNFWSWIAYLLPYLEEAPLQDRFDFAEYAFPDDVSTVQRAVALKLPVLQCATDERANTVSRAFPEAPFAYTSYLGNAGTQGRVPIEEFLGDGMFRSPFDFPEISAPIPLGKVTDGTSNTVFVGERPIIEWRNSGGDFGWWAAGAGLLWPPAGRGDNVLDSSQGLRTGTPQADTFDDIFHWWSYHPGGGHFVFVDVSTHFISYDMDHRVLLAISSRNGGETETED